MDKEIQNEINRLDGRIDTHQHTGTDSDQLYPQYFRGFPIYTSTPTHNAEEGTIVLQNDGSSTFKIFVRLNGAWKSVAVS